jgi:hypothetical protein
MFGLLETLRQDLSNLFVSDPQFYFKNNLASNLTSRPTGFHRSRSRIHTKNQPSQQLIIDNHPKFKSNPSNYEY